MLFIATSASAATMGGAILPDTYPVAGQPLALNGIGLRTLTVFNVKAYVAGLYLAKPSRNAAEILASTTPKVLLLQFLHSGSKAEVEAQFRKGEETNCASGGCAPADQADFEALIKAMPGVAVGDTLTFMFDGRGGGRVLTNNRQISSFTNPDLCYQLLNGFIGPRPPSTDLRQHLLGLGS